MNRKKQLLAFAIIILLFFITIGCFVLAKNQSGMFQIPIFSILYESVKIGFQFAYGFIKMFGLAIWGVVTDSWISILVMIGIIIVYMLKRIYYRTP